MASSKEIKEEYTSSLADLTFNSKPLISVLTMLAEENVQHARDIVEAIETHLAKVRTDVKLPVLYLIDCIIKNVGGPYLELFCQNIVPTFCSVFQSVDERTRAEMFKLRQTWNEYLPPQKLYAMDVQIQMLDPAWPVSAKPPSSLIHVNPKFLNSTNNTNVSGTKKTNANTKQTSKVLTMPPVSAASALDPQTLDMQQKLINKQKQLIELQQKKLELELLQAQVKLQEQLKNSNSSTKLKTTSTTANGSQGNLLLKPEVAKQLVNTTVANKSSSITSVTSTSARPRPTATQSSSSSSSLVMSQRVQNVNASGNGGLKIAAPSGALIAAGRPIRDPRLRRQQQQNQNNIVNSNVQLESKQQVDSANKIVVNSKMNRTEARSITNKDNNTSAPTEKIKSVTRPIPKSRSKLHDESVRKLVKTTSKNLDSDAKGDSSSKSSSTTSLDSPIKLKRDKKPQSPSKSSSPLKFKKKDIDNKKVSPTKSDTHHKPVKSDAAAAAATSPTFKDIKQSMKNRNYIRRNRKTSESPDTATTQDVDLRVGGPPEKQGESTEKKCATATTAQGMDIDLRQLPAVIGKKRSSTESSEANAAKKSKTEMFDVLFGNEDTDLRQLSAPVAVASPPQCDKPPTPPPPPIISSNKSPKKSKLDVLRAKLNNATLKEKRAGGIDFDARKVDTDLRSFISPQTSPEKSSFSKIVITPDDEQSIKADKLTTDQKTALWSKIVEQMHNQDGETLGNITLQPISDEEMEGDFSEEEEMKKTVPHGDKDERVPALHMGTQKPAFYNRTRQHPNWRGGGGRRSKYFDGPHGRSGARPARPAEGGPWMRNVNGGPWRPMGPSQNFPRTLLSDNYIPPSSNKPGEQQSEFVQEISGRSGNWTRGNGPWRSMGFNRGDNYISTHRQEHNQDSVASPDRNSNSPHMFQNITLQQQTTNMDVIIPSTTDITEPITTTTQSSSVPPMAPPPLPPPPLNITELLQKLVESGIVTTTASEQSTTQMPIMGDVVSSSSKVVAVKKGLMNIKPVTFSRPETLKIFQPTVFQILYSGMQCSSCGMRFPPEQSMLYSQHLDWHFRQNRKGKKNIRKAASRKWYYTVADWKNYEEIEDLEEREKSYFDQQQAQTEGANEETEEEIEIPTVLADPNVQDAHCEICQDRFEQFYNEEKEEWQLRMAIRVNNKTYHPLCYEDYQASLNIPIDISATEDAPSPKELEDQRIPGLEIVLDDDEEEEDAVKSEQEETLQEEKPAAEEEEEEETENINEEEDDDVILNEVAPERIVLDDDDDDNEERSEYEPIVKVKVEPIDDGFMDVDGVVKVKKDGEIKIKAEPKDPDETLMDMEEASKPEVDTTHTDVHVFIDGNVEFDTGTVTTGAPSFGGKIKININKPLPILLPKETTKEVPVESELNTGTFIDPSQPLPPGEEPVQLNLKPTLQGVELKRLPSVEKGRELTGLCSIM